MNTMIAITGIAHFVMLMKLEYVPFAAFISCGLLIVFSAAFLGAKIDWPIL